MINSHKFLKIITQIKLYRKFKLGKTNRNLLISFACKELIDSWSNMLEFVKKHANNLKEEFFVKRPLYTYKSFRKTFPETPGQSFLVKFLVNIWRKQCRPSSACFKYHIFNRLPFIRLLNQYKKEYFLFDFLTGIEV